MVGKKEKYNACPKSQEFQFEISLRLQSKGHAWSGFWSYNGLPFLVQNVVIKHQDELGRDKMFRKMDIWSFWVQPKMNTTAKIEATLFISVELISCS